MKKTKYYNLILDGKWKVIECCNLRYYKLVNIYNGQIVEIEHRTLSNIIKGKTSVSRIISLRLHKNRIGYEIKRVSNKFYK